MMLLYRELYLVGGDVVVKLKSFLVTLDSNGIILPAVPPVSNPHTTLAHLPPLRTKIPLLTSRQDLKAPDLRPGHLTDLFLFLKVEETKEVSYPAVWGDVRLPPDTAVGKVGLDGDNGQLIFIHRLKKRLSKRNNFHFFKD